VSGRQEGSRAKPRPDRRLSRTDWLEAGQAVLRELGISELKLARVTKRLGVSTGSFYHHFTDFDEYLGAVADHYNVDQVRLVVEKAAEGGADPLTRIRRLRQLSVNHALFQLDAAMRVWGATDSRAAAAMRSSEAVVLDFLADAFGDLGFDRETAAMRARMLLSLNVARIEGGTPPGSSFFKAALELLTSDAPRQARRAKPARAVAPVKAARRAR
jgi:AcrR family transcriptional regulator